MRRLIQISPGTFSLCLKLKERTQRELWADRKSSHILHIYSRTSMARTLMARLPWLFRTRSWVPRKSFIAADLGQFRVIFFNILKMVYCVFSLESPHWGDSNENTQHTFMSIENQKGPPDLALLSTLTGSNYPCLELIFMVPKVFEPLKFDCT